MSALLLIVGLVAAARVSELVYSAHNARALKERGAIELGGGHYSLIVALHAAWLAALIVFVPWSAPINWFWLGAYIALQVLRLWTIASLGPFWTARIYSLPGTKLVRRGPYRFVAHPNYLIVAGEIAVLPLVFGAWRIALAFSVINAVLLAWRIRIEERGLEPRRALG
ncbi:MAG TPA: isoprenylcysteine carboxylmethyltransferase family protein [Stellaceae bacterium]|nr:isoprenylcysteine carboxylmethyltransferase family protein [Stellaceae bacterium]